MLMGKLVEKYYHSDYQNEIRKDLRIFLNYFSRNVSILCCLFCFHIFYFKISSLTTNEKLKVSSNLKVSSKGFP